MIRSWTLRNLKSYQDSHTVPLSWINVIAGANSSGKSTIIQSILLLKQTVLYGHSDKSLLLNGPLLRLGSFDDVLNSSCDSGEVSIGFEASFTKDEMQHVSKEWMRNSHLMYFGASREEYISHLSVRVDWERSPENLIDGLTQTRFSPNLITSEISVEKSSGTVRNSRFVRLRSWRNQEPRRIQGVPMQAETDSDSVSEMIADKPDAHVAGGYSAHFLPQSAAIEYDSAAQRARDVANSLFSQNAAWMMGSTSKHDDFVFPQAVANYIYSWLSRNGVEISEQDRKDDYPSIKSIVHRLLPPLDFLSHSKLPEKMAAEALEGSAVVTDMLRSHFGRDRDVDFAFPASIRQGTQFITEWFRTGVKYLGPLRDPPRPVYQLEALPSTTDVGYRGEHTAAVLDLNARRQITYHRPPSNHLEDDYIGSAKTKRAVLQEAVADWLSYLGVAEEVKTSDEGVFGNRLRVSTGGKNQLHDLTNVGVGVSQVLPIVVMALLAPRSSLLIFEQPELHLHPKVQARLADFFLSLAMSGKQTLAETHSEYLIDRFRLRIALSEGNAVNQLVNILFSERTGTSTTLVPIEISEYGAVLNWPKDFFDQSQSDVAKILKAASIKRRKKQETPS